MCAITVIASCAGTKVVHQWHTEAGPGSKASKLAVVAMMPEEGMRLAVENVISAEINSSGGNAVSSSSIRGMRGKLTREKAVEALEVAGADAVVVVFITGTTKGEKLQRADYYATYEGSVVYANWLAPQYVNVYSIHEGPGYYEQERTLTLETSYIQFPSAEARWTMITESSALEYRATAQAVSDKIVGQMRKDGSL
jgi:hypothetical protein